MADLILNWNMEQTQTLNPPLVQPQTPGAKLPQPGAKPTDTKAKKDTKGKDAKATDQPEEPGVPQLTFWQKPMVQDVLPFCSSLFLHLSLLLLAFLTVRAVPHLVRIMQEQFITPSGDLVTTGQTPDVLGNPNGVADGVGPINVEFPNATPDELLMEAKEGNGRPAKIGGGGEGDKDEQANMLQLGMRGMGIGHGSGGGKGDFIGPGDGKGLPFGYRDGVEGGTSIFRAPPRGSLNGVRTVIYVCDASGSMQQNEKFDLLREQLEKAVKNLSRIHAFNVVLFARDGQCSIANSREMMIGSPENKQRTFSFLDDIATGGGTNPVPALAAAFKQKPELIWLLTDGAFGETGGPSNEVVIQQIRELQKSMTKRVMINTIAFVDQDPKCESVLKTIASENGGVYKFVKKEEMLDNGK